MAFTILVSIYRDHKLQQIRRSNPDEENTHSGEKK